MRRHRCQQAADYSVPTWSQTPEDPPRPQTLFCSIPGGLYSSTGSPSLSLTIIEAAPAVAGLTGMAPRANAATGDSITFNLRVSAGASTCLATASGRATISDQIGRAHV